MFVGEHVKLVNYHIHKAVEENDLIVDIDHPQLTAPDDYSPQKFVDNLKQIINDIKNKLLNV